MLHVIAVHSLIDAIGMSHSPPVNEILCTTVFPCRDGRIAFLRSLSETFDDISQLRISFDNTSSA
jgi:hypothetical protein